MVKCTPVGYQVECKYWVALALKEQNKISDALSWAETAFAQSEKRNDDSELEGPFENFREIRDQLERLHMDLRRKSGDFLVDEESLLP